VPDLNIGSPGAADSSRASAFARRLEGIGVVLAWLAALAVVRSALVLGSGAGLHVDEAQYWDWSRDLSWGYYSKPPGIAALIAASTALFADGLLGVRALAMACWLVSSLVTYALVRSMGRPDAAAAAALLLAATPASGLLGMAATTDAPLVLCWSLLMWAGWNALHGPGPRARWWALAGLALGLGGLSKYTIAVGGLGLAWAAWRSATPRPWAGAFVALLIGAALFAPNLAWNAQAGWPTWQHTAEITVGAQRPAGRSVLASLGEHVAGQLLLAGPVLLAAAAFAALARRRSGAEPDQAAARRFALAFFWPLMLIGLALALRSRTQMNWTAPALVGACVWVGLAAPRGFLARWRLHAAVAAGVLICAAVALAPRLGSRAEPAAWDIWARMRGWDTAMAALRPAIDAHPAEPLLATQRDLIVQAAYAWRDRQRAVLAFPHEGRPRHHYELRDRAAWGDPALRCAPAWLVLGGAVPPGDETFGHGEPVRLARVRAGRGEVVLWRLTRSADRPCGAAP
jgi:hypothetical protein